MQSYYLLNHTFNNSKDNNMSKNFSTRQKGVAL